MSAPRQLRLVDYYLIEAFTSMAATLFLYCVFFWTQWRFEFTNAQNLFLGAAQGLAYVLGARFGGKIADRLGYSRQIGICLGASALVLGLGWTPGWKWTPFAVMILYAVCISPIWPALEAGILHAPGRLSTPRRLGIYNLTWSSASALGFFLGGPLFAWRPASVLWVPAALHAALLAWLLWSAGRYTPTGSAAMSIPHRGDSVPRAAKRRFMLVGLTANSAAYFLQAGLTALLPHLAARLGLSPAAGIWLASSLLFARAGSFLLFWKWESWHYREWANLVGCFATPICLATVFYGGTVPMVFGGLLGMGFAVGVAYYMSIFYTLDYGEKKGEGGGRHESVLGTGMLAGPLVGALAARYGGGAAVAQLWIIGLGALLSIGGYAAVSLLARGRRVPL